MSNSIQHQPETYYHPYIGWRTVDWRNASFSRAAVIDLIYRINRLASAVAKHIAPGEHEHLEICMSNAVNGQTHITIIPKLTALRGLSEPRAWVHPITIFPNQDYVLVGRELFEVNEIAYKVYLFFRQNVPQHYLGNWFKTDTLTYTFAA